VRDRRARSNLWLRAQNRLKKAAAGLPFSLESVWPGVPNDLFVAHCSIYRFFGEFVPGQRVLDAACGTGYGTYEMAAAGASSAVGIDRDAGAVRYAKRAYGGGRVDFRCADLSVVRFPPNSFDVVASSNTLEHLDDPGEFVARARSWLNDAGLLLVAVPPIYSAADLDMHAENPFHASNLSATEWWSLFVSSGWTPQLFRHRYLGLAPLDFSSPRRSNAQVEDFEFSQVGLEQFYEAPSITAVFVLKKSR
jgi:SAM-dependent methyltransferase